VKNPVVYDGAKYENISQPLLVPKKDPIELIRNITNEYKLIGKNSNARNKSEHTEEKKFLDQIEDDDNTKSIHSHTKYVFINVEDVWFSSFLNDLLISKLKDGDKF
jgi:hypothetical protein